MTNITALPPLENGDEIRIVAPASRVETDYIYNTIKSLENLGYHTTIGLSVFESDNQFAGSDELRAADMQSALDDPKVKAVFCARGGYGSVRIIDKLDFSGFVKNPKWIVGFSDITVFHSYLNCKLHIPTIHAPMPVNYDSPLFGENLSQLDKLLKDRGSEIKFTNQQISRKGKAEGKLVGGNLSILYSLQSTPYEIDTNGMILFIEDVGEQLYHLDRIMNNFRLSGKLRNIKGLLVGEFTEMQDKKRPFGKTYQEIIFDYVSSFDIPVAFGFPAGHCQNNRPFYLGKNVRLEVNDEISSLLYL